MYKQNVTQIHNLDSDQLLQSISDLVETKLKQLVNELRPATGSEPKYITRKEAAKFLGVSLVTLNSWANKGIIHPKKIGSLVRYDKLQLERAVQ